jgi:NADPH:quinone reductase
MRWESVSMKAVVMHEHGGPEVLRLEDVARPTLGPEDVLIAVEAVSVNRTLDLAVRAGRYSRTVTFPHILGADPTGVIVETGSAVTTRKVGDRVATSPRLTPLTEAAPPTLLGVNAWGGYAEYVRVPAWTTYRIPDGLDFPQATVIARHAPLAFNMLQNKAQLRPGEWVLVMGAAGGLGSIAVQVAKHLGAHVIAAAGSRARADSALALGADAAIDYRGEDLTARVRALTQGRGVNIVLENVGDPDLFPRALAGVARNGRLVTAGAHAGGMASLDLNFLYLNQITIMGSTAQTEADVTAAFSAAAQGKLTGHISAVLPFSQAEHAHRVTANRDTVGKVLLRPDRLLAGKSA